MRSRRQLIHPLIGFGAAYPFPIDLVERVCHIELMCESIMCENRLDQARLLFRLIGV